MSSSVHQGEEEIVEDLKIENRALLNSSDVTASTVNLSGCETIENKESLIQKDTDDKKECLLPENENKDPYIGLRAHAHEHQLKGTFLEEGWRINFDNFRKSWKSLFMIHNETVNIWTHLIGSVIFVIMIFYILFGEDNLYDVLASDEHHVPKWPIIIAAFGGTM